MSIFHGKIKVHRKILWTVDFFVDFLCLWTFLKEQFCLSFSEKQTQSGKKIPINGSLHLLTEFWNIFIFQKTDKNQMPFYFSLQAFFVSWQAVYFCPQANDRPVTHRPKGKK